MIKKRFLLIILVALLTISAIQALDPQAITENLADDVNQDGIPTKLEPLVEIGEKFSEGEITESYLKQEWDKILEKHPIFLEIASYFKSLNPIFKIVLAEEFSFTLTFFFVLLIWFWFFASTFSIIRKTMHQQEIVSILLSIIITILLAWTNLLRLTAKSLVTLITFTENTFARILLSAFVVVIIVALYVFLESFAKSFEEGNKEKRKKQATEAEKKMIKHAEIFEEELRS